MSEYIKVSCTDVFIWLIIWNLGPGGSTCSTRTGIGTVTSFRWLGCNYLKNIRRISTSWAKTLPSGVTKGLRSKRRNSPYNFQVVSSLSMKACSYYGTDSSRFRVSCSCMNYSSSLHSNGETCTCQYGFRIRPSDPVIYWAHYSENASI